jgi:hypothetical protein
MMMMLRCAAWRLLSPHHLVCSGGGLTGGGRKTALTFAVIEGHDSIARLLLEYKADVNARDE